MATDLDDLREGLAEDLVNQIARVIDPDAHHLGRPDYYGPEPILAGSSARVRVARRTAGNIISGPLVPLIAKAESADRLMAERDEARVERDYAVRALRAWFDTNTKATAQLLPKLTDAMKGYLRTSRAGGMPYGMSEAVEACLSDFIQRQAGTVVTPVVEALVEERTSATNARADRLAAEVEALRAALVATKTWIDTELEAGTPGALIAHGVISTALAADKADSADATHTAAASEGG